MMNEFVELSKSFEQLAKELKKFFNIYKNLMIESGIDIQILWIDDLAEDIEWSEGAWVDYICDDISSFYNFNFVLWRCSERFEE